MNQKYYQSMNNNSSNNYPGYGYYVLPNGDRQFFFFPFLTGALVGGAAVGLTRPRPIYNVAPQNTGRPGSYGPYNPGAPQYIPGAPYYNNSYNYYVPRPY